MIIRRVFVKNLIRVNYYHVNKTSGSFFSSKAGNSTSSSSSDSDDEKKKVPDTKKPPVSSTRLNELLASMTVSDHQGIVGKSIDVTPESLRKRKENQKSQKQKKIEEEKNVEKVAKNVAESIGGDAKQTEVELLKKLLDISSEASEAKIRTDGEDSSKLNDIIVGMKVERTKKPPKSESGTIFRRGTPSRRTSDDSERFQRERVDVRAPPVPKEFDRINLWSGQRLNIFPTNTVQESEDPLKVWSLLKNRDLNKVFETPPRNYFEKMQRWTSEGKIWRFPIDNEQGLEEEGKIYFADHVFLEPHLEPWCPKSGPIRHFMELVCVGLSKNPYLTVKEKQDHIFWFRDYFDSKKKLLQEIIVQDGETQQGKIKQKVSE
ncbi:28S ribosomal protein S31, mitochondrial [Sergentomyia squamirostris]